LLQFVEKLEVCRRDLLVKRLMYVIPLSAVAVLLLAAPALTQNAPNHIDASPTQTTDAKQITGNAATDPTTTPSETTAPAESTTPAPDSTTTVEILNNAFNPDQLNVAPSTTVTWVNRDSVAHTVTADNGLFDSGQLAPGASYPVVLEGAGTVTYHCELHPEMRGSIVVGEPGQASEGGETGITTTPPNQAVSVYP
jgi:plastocyanin